jgi:hypothetical protein
MAKSPMVAGYPAKLFVVLSVFLIVTLSMTNKKLRGNDGKQKTYGPVTIKNEPPAIVDKLFDLVLENWDAPGHNQLAMLLLPKNPKHKKLFLQFYLNSSGDISLAAYVGKKRRRKFDPAPQILTVRASRDVQVDLSGKHIYLSDQEISTEKQNGEKNINTLRSIINDPKYKFIIFRPRLEPNDHIVFDLYYTDDASKAFTADTFLNVSTNPSPPKDAHY